MTGWRVGWMVVPDALVRAGRAAAAESRDLGADALADRRRRRLRRARRDGSASSTATRRTAASWSRGCRRPGSTSSCRSTARSISTPTSRASPTTASTSPSACWRRRASRRRRASISIRCTASEFIRFCYAGSAADMREAVERIGALVAASVESITRISRSALTRLASAPLPPRYMQCILTPSIRPHGRARSRDACGRKSRHGAIKHVERPQRRQRSRAP